MKRLSFGTPLGGPSGFQAWVTDALRAIEGASAEDIETVISEFSTTGTVTEQRTFNAATATVADLRNVLATMIQDIRRGGQKRAG